MDEREFRAALEAVLFAAGDPVPAERVAKVLGAEAREVLEAAERLAEDYERRRAGIRLLRLGDKLQLCTAAQYNEFVTHALEQRRPPRLSQAALEVLAIVAYFQPVTRAYIDQMRGVDSTYTVGMLAERGLIEEAGRLEVPGRPALFRTGDAFLRTMQLQSLDELPPLPDIGTDEGMIALQNQIDALRGGELAGQMSIGEDGAE
jgi:segregation and condensation protein B